MALHSELRVAALERQPADGKAAGRITTNTFVQAVAEAAAATLSDTQQHLSGDNCAAHCGQEEEVARATHRAGTPYTECCRFPCLAVMERQMMEGWSRSRQSDKGCSMRLPCCGDGLDRGRRQLRRVDLPPSTRR